MAVKGNLPLYSRHKLKSRYRDEDKADTDTAKSERKWRDKSDTAHKKKKQANDQSKIFDGLKTLYS